jgi:hypothetical protein
MHPKQGIPVDQAVRAERPGLARGSHAAAQRPAGPGASASGSRWTVGDDGGTALLRQLHQR